MIKVLFFAQLSDIAQCNALELELESSNVKGLLNDMQGHVSDALLDQLKEQTSMVSINQQYASWDSELSDGDEVGFLPPVSGG